MPYIYQLKIRRMGRRHIITVSKLLIDAGPGEEVRLDGLRLRNQTRGNPVLD